MSWSEEVKVRFSDQEDAAKWDRMYEGNAATLEEEFFRLRRDFTVDYLTDKFDKAVPIFDLGCGAAPVTYEMLKRGHNIVGADYSLDMLMNATRRLMAGGVSERPLVNSNGETLPFQDEMFECVVCLGVISYVENYENVIKEINRVLKPGGTVIISFRSKYNLLSNDPVSLFKNIVKNVLIKLKLRRPDKFRIGHYMVCSEVMHTIQSNGFEFETFKGIGFGPYSVWGNKFLSVKNAIKFSSFITRTAERFGFGYLFKIASDVNILIYTKDR